MKFMDICVLPTFLPIVNNAAMHIHIQVSVWTYVVISLGWILKCRMMQFYGNCLVSKKIKITMFLIWKVYWFFASRIYWNVHVMQPSDSVIDPFNCVLQMSRTCATQRISKSWYYSQKAHELGGETDHDTEGSSNEEKAGGGERSRAFRRTSRSEKIL